ncbi:MAG: flagellar type III secretion system pore protein FliP [Chloroflexi bacterium]|nr:flagellar type III secretion system pore protein FliP [Chloroflexota bacterium]
MRPACAPRLLGVALPMLALLAAGCASTAPGGAGAPALPLEVADSAGGRLTAVQIVVLLTVLSLAPAFLMLFTSFTRIIIVLSFVRSAIGVQQLPPNQVFIGLALFLTFFVMSPVWDQVHQQALGPYLTGELPQDQAFNRGMAPLRQFMLKQTREKDIELFLSMTKIPAVNTPDDVPNHVLLPAFVISELKTGFQMGFLVFVPFLIIDLVVSSTLMSMGMMMLPPVVVSLPFKVLFFVLVDGWHLVVRSLLMSFS